MQLTLSINCKDAGDTVCNHTMYGETEEELWKMPKNMAWTNMVIQKNPGMRYYQKILNISRRY